MSESLTFFIPGVAIPQGSKRWLPNGHMKEANDKLRPWRETVTGYAVRAFTEAGSEVFSGALYVSMSFVYQRPKWHFGTGKNAGKVKPSAPTFHAVQPDLDKLVRAINDGITDAGVWHDDSQVAVINTSKMYAERDFGVTVVIEALR